MNTKFKIEISDIAYEKIKDLLKINTEYSYLRFVNIPLCGSKSKLEISLDDKIEADDTKITFKNLLILYKKENLKDYHTIFLIFEDDTFKIRGEKNSEVITLGCGCSNKNCSSSSKDCGETSCCGGCKNP